MKVERRWAAILSADAKGFSRLMGEDELGTVRTLIAYRTVMRDAISGLRWANVSRPAPSRTYCPTP